MSRGQPTSGDETGGVNRPKSGEFQAVAGPEGAQSLSARAVPSVAPSDSADIDSAWDSPESSRARALNNAAKLAPKRVISIGPSTAEPPVADKPPAADKPAARSKPTATPATKDRRRQIEPLNAGPKPSTATPPVESKTAGVALLESRSKPPAASSASSGLSSPPAGALAAPRAVNTDELEKLLTEAPQSECSPLDIGALVTNVMGSQRPEPTSPTPAKATEPTSAQAPPQESKSVAFLSQSPTKPSAENVMEADGWDLPSESSVPVGESLALAVADFPQAKVTPEAKSVPKVKKADKKQQIGAAKKASAAEKSKSASEHIDSEWTGEFFAINPETIAHDGYFQDSEEAIDEHHLRSLHPEVLARRSRYRVLVLRVVIGMVLLLVAAVALKMLRHH